MSKEHSPEEHDFYASDFEDVSLDEVNQVIAQIFGRVSEMAPVNSYSEFRTIKHLFLGRNALMLDGLIYELKDLEGNTLSSYTDFNAVSARVYEGPATAEDERLTDLLLETMFNDSDDKKRSTLEKVTKEIPRSERAKRQEHTMCLYANGSLVSIDKDIDSSDFRAKVKTTDKLLVLTRDNENVQLGLIEKDSDDSLADVDFISHSNSIITFEYDDGTEPVIVPTIEDNDYVPSLTQNKVSRGSLREFSQALMAAIESGPEDYVVY